MYAVIKTGGKQYRVSPGDLLVVEKLEGDPGAAVAFGDVLMLGDGEAVTLGAPLVSGASVAATLVETRKGEKVKIFKKIRRQGYRRTRGHRSARHQRRAQRHRLAIAQHQHIAKRHGRAGFAFELFNHQQVAGADPVLLAAGLDHRVHRSRLRY